MLPGHLDKQSKSSVAQVAAAQTNLKHTHSQNMREWADSRQGVANVEALKRPTWK